MASDDMPGLGSAIPSCIISKFTGSSTTAPSSDTPESRVMKQRRDQQYKLQECAAASRAGQCFTAADLYYLRGPQRGTDARHAASVCDGGAIMTPCSEDVFSNGVSYPRHAWMVTQGNGGITKEQERPAEWKIRRLRGSSDEMVCY